MIYLRGIIAGFWLFIVAFPIGAQTAEQDGAALKSVLVAINAQRWDDARELAEAVSDPVAVDIVDWFWLRGGNGSFADYNRFLTANADWPGLKLLRKKAERTLQNALPAGQVIAFFTETKPQTGLGVLQYSRALRETNDVYEADSVLTTAWATLALTQAERVVFLENHGDLLEPFHTSRLDWLLWEGKLTEAQSMLDLVEDGAQTLAKARIGLQRDANGVDQMIAAIPEAFADDGGLAYDRFQWRLKKGYWDSAHDLIVERGLNMGRPDYWASRRRTFARRAMRLGQIDVAYQISTQHGLRSGSSYADLEWFAGFLALRHMNDAAQALVHFQNHRNAIRSPISMGRAGYWIGQAHAALNDGQANEAYRMGADFQTSFYGQLAAVEGGFEPDSRLTGAEFPPDWTVAEFLRHESVRAGVLFYFAGDANLAKRFLAHVSETLPADQQAALGQLALDLNLPNTALKIAKIAARVGTVLPDPYYPVTALAAFSEAVPPELAMAIARQESELNPTIKSPAGAYGLMQVMPATARQVASGLGIAFSQHRLANDWEYNARLGTAYLAQMLERYDGSVLLAAAAYNAGPHRADRWIAEYGDPRKAGVNAVDWIETIPFRETRNYVMRVLESQYVYRNRITGEVQPLTLAADLGL